MYMHASHVRVYVYIYVIVIALHANKQSGSAIHSFIHVWHVQSSLTSSVLVVIFLLILGKTNPSVSMQLFSEGEGAWAGVW